MNKKPNKDQMLQDSLKKHPFRVPEGYFESFSERVQERIREEKEREQPVRRIGTFTRFRVAMAAAVVGLALISYSVIRITGSRGGTNGSFPDVALLEQLHMIDDDSYLIDLMESETEELDAEEAFATQAIEYLAIKDVEMDLIFE